MDIRRLFAIVKRWLWLLILGAVLGAGLGYYISIQETPMYRTSTRFIILRAASTNYYDYYAYTNYQELISTYAQLLTTESLLKEVSEEVGFPVYANQASTAQVGDTQFVRLTVTHSDPVRAAVIANTLVDVLIRQNEQLQSVRYEATEKNYQNRADQAMEQMESLQEQIRSLSVVNLQEQLDQVQAQIDDLQSQVTDLEFSISLINPEFATDQENYQRLQYQAELSGLRPLLDLYQEIYTELVVMGEPMERENATSTQMAQLERTLNLYEQIYFNSLSSLEALNLTRVQSSPNVVKVEQAVVPDKPFTPKPFQTAGLYAAIGFIAMAGIVFLVEYLDDTVKTPEDVKDVLNLPVIGLVADMNGRSKSRKSRYPGVFVEDKPRSPITEAFRSLRTSLEFYSVDQPLQILVVTSPGPEEGKTTIASNLAVILAKSNKSVLLMDADLRRPNIHNQLSISNRVGLSDLIRGKLTAQEVTQVSESIENLSVITSGSLPPNPAELLASHRMTEIIQELSSQYDMIVIDTPPAIVSDAQILASKADGVIYVLRPGKTRRLAVLTPIEEFNRVGANIIGVVLNRIPRNRDYYYGGFDYYAPSAHVSEKYYRSGDKD